MVWNIWRTRGIWKLLVRVPSRARVRMACEREHGRGRRWEGEEGESERGSGVEQAERCRPIERAGEESNGAREIPDVLAGDREGVIPGCWARGIERERGSEWERYLDVGREGKSLVSGGIEIEWLESEWVSEWGKGKRVDDVESSCRTTGDGGGGNSVGNGARARPYCMCIRGGSDVAKCVTCGGARVRIGRRSARGFGAQVFHLSDSRARGARRRHPTAAPPPHPAEQCASPRPGPRFTADTVSLPFHAAVAAVRVIPGVSGVRSSGGGDNTILNAAHIRTPARYDVIILMAPLLNNPAYNII